jgi:serine/threonine protein kinase
MNDQETVKEDPVQRFYDLWRQGQQPDAHAFLATLANLPAADAQAILAVDQRERWSRGDKVTAECYVQAFPDVLSEPESALQLVYAEFLLREQLGETPTKEEYLRRFPSCALLLEQQFRLHALLKPTARWTSADESSQESSGGPDMTVPSRLMESGHRQATASDLPARVGRYLLGDEIARGGMGRIVRVCDQDFDRPLAMKILLGVEDEIEKRFMHEARLTGVLQHPGIPPVHALGRLDDGRPYFVMKLIQGRTLQALLKERLSPGAEVPRFLAIFEQMCQTVGYAHARGVIHRDLKPGNMMVGTFGEVQVLDWGLAKVLRTESAEEHAVHAAEGTVFSLQRTAARSGETVAGSILGTPSYMAPEQARVEVEGLDARADVFSLGAILCEILTGRPAFRGQSSDQVCRQAARAELGDALAALDSCGADAEVVALARKCLNPERDQRPGDAGQVAAAMAAYQTQLQQRLQAAEMARAAAQIKVKEGRKRRRLAVALTICVLLGLLAGLTWYWDHRSRRALTEQGVRQSLDQAQNVHDQLQANLKEPDGIQELLNQPARWEMQLGTARANWKRAKAWLPITKAVSIRN